MTRVIRATQTVSGRHMLRDYNALKAHGYTRLWAGNGQICMEAPEVGAPLREPVEVVVCDALPVDWTPLLRAIELAELHADSIDDFMWMGEESPGVQMYKNRDTRNYAHLTGTETRDEALLALNHAHNANEKWADRPARTAAVKDR